MSLPVPSFAALAAGNQNLSLLDLQFNALGACVEIPCTAVGSNAVILTPMANTPSITVYTTLTPKLVWTQAQSSTLSVTIQVAGGLAALNAYRNNGQTAVGSGDLVAGSSYTAFYLPSLNSGAGGFVVDVVPLTATSGTLVSVVVYSATATITIPSGASKAYVQMWGATGGSGGSGAGLTGGTGAAGYLEKYLTALTAGNTLAYTQGAAGAAGTNVPGDGGNGSAPTTLASGTQTISTLTCNASNGSHKSTTDSLGTAGGTATGGDVNITGQPGASGSIGSSVAPGGVNFFSTGANGLSAAGTGNAGTAGGLKITWTS